VPVGQAHRLDAPAADVQPEAVRDRGRVGDREPAVAGLLATADHARSEAGVPADGVEQLVAVGGVADGAGRDRLDLIDPGGAAERVEDGGRVERAVDALRLQDALLAHPRAHAHRLADLVHRAPPGGAGLVAVDDQTPRVRAQVGHGDALHGAGSCLTAVQPSLAGLNRRPQIADLGGVNAMATARAVPASGPQLDNRRVLAALIDLAVVGAGTAVILAAGGVLGSSASEIGTPLIAVSLGWALYYHFACESSDSAQTLGKRVMKIRVERANGDRADMRDIAVRTVLRVVDMQFVYLVGLIVMLATGERRGRVGDLVAGTRIVSADAPAAAPAAAAVAAEPEALRVPIAESGPAFEPVAEAEPVVEDEPVAEAEDEPGEGDTVVMASPSLTELAADVEATAGSAPDEEEPAEEEPAAEEELADEPVAEDEPLDDDLVNDDPLTDPEPETEGDEEVELAPAAEAEGDEPAAQVEDEEGEDVKRIETVSAIDLVMEDSQRKS
jgi:uncharacterized RDD family membrane protein YckC